MQGFMIKRRIPALLIALSSCWLSTSALAKEAKQVDPVAAIDLKLSTKQAEIDSVAKEYDIESAKLQQLNNEFTKLQRDADALNAKRNRAKSALDKQYNRLLEDPDTDLVSFQKKYQQAWSAVKANQNNKLESQQAITENEMRLSQIKQKQARLNTESVNLEEQRVEARVKRMDTELRESSVLETTYKTTCSTTMTLGECASQGKHLAKQKAVKSFRAKLMEHLTESVIARQNVKGVQLNIHVQESQIMRAGFEGNNKYFTQLQAQLQAKPAAIAACELLDVSSRYCVKGETGKNSSHKDKSWANVTVRSDQYNDSVTINGIDYGSTPVELVLPAGRHQVTVSKSGYETYNRTIYVRGKDTVWVKLRPSKRS